MASGVTPSSPKMVSFNALSARASTSSSQARRGPTTPPRLPTYSSGINLDLTEVIAAREGMIPKSTVPSKVPSSEEGSHTAHTQTSSTSSSESLNSEIDNPSCSNSTRTRSNSLTEKGSPKEAVSDFSPSSGPLSARSLRKSLRLEEEHSLSPHQLLSPSSSAKKLARERFPLLHATNEVNPEDIAKELLSEYNNPARDLEDRKLALSTCHSRLHPEQLALILDQLFYLPRGTEFIYAYLTSFRQDTEVVAKKIIQNKLDNLEISARLTLLTQLDSSNHEPSSLFPDKGVSFSFAYEFVQSLISSDVDALKKNIEEFSKISKISKPSHQIKNILKLVFSMRLSIHVKQVLEVRRNFYDHQLKEGGLDERNIALQCEKMVSKFLYKSVLIPVITKLPVDRIKASTFKRVCKLLESFANQECPRSSSLRKIYDKLLGEHQLFISQISEYRFIAEEDTPDLTPSCSTSPVSPSSRRRLRMSLLPTKNSPPKATASSSYDTFHSNPLKETALWSFVDSENEFKAEVLAKELTRSLKKGAGAERSIGSLLKQIWHLIEQEKDPELKVKLESRLDQLFGALVFDPSVSQFVFHCLNRGPNVANADLFAQGALDLIKSASDSKKKEFISFEQILAVYSKEVEQALLASKEPETFLRGNNFASSLSKALITHYGNGVFSDYIDEVLKSFWEFKKNQEMPVEEAFEQFTAHAIVSLHKKVIPDEVKRILIKLYELGFQRILFLKPEMPIEEIRRRAMIFMGGELFLRLLNPSMIKVSAGERWIMDFAIILQKLTNNTSFNASSTQVAFPDVCGRICEVYSKQHQIYLARLCELGPLA